MVSVDISRCTACKNCEVACAKAHAGYEDFVEALLGDFDGARFTDHSTEMVLVLRRQ